MKQLSIKLIHTCLLSVFILLVASCNDEVDCGDGPGPILIESFDQTFIEKPTAGLPANWWVELDQSQSHIAKDIGLGLEIKYKYPSMSGFSVNFSMFEYASACSFLASEILNPIKKLNIVLKSNINETLLAGKNINELFKIAGKDITLEDWNQEVEDSKYNRQFNSISLVFSEPSTIIAGEYLLSFSITLSDGDVLTVDSDMLIIKSESIAY